MTTPDNNTSNKAATPQPTAIQAKKQITLDSTASSGQQPISSIEKKATEDKVDKVDGEEKKIEQKVEKPIVKKVKKRSKISFEETTHKFGTIKSGDKVNHKFKFKNNGNAPLVIRDVQVSCGCTFPSYTFLPIKPNETGEIDVTFNSEHKSVINPTQLQQQSVL